MSLLSLVHLLSDEFKNFFSKFGKVTEYEIIRDHVSKRSRGFGFIVFDNEEVVDNLLAEGNRMDMMGTQVNFVGYFFMISNVLGHDCRAYIVDPALS